MFSLSLPVSLMGRLLASLVDLTTTQKEHHNPQCWECRWDLSGVPPAKNLHLMAVTVLESHLQDCAPSYTGGTLMDISSNFYLQ